MHLERGMPHHRALTPAILELVRICEQVLQDVHMNRGTDEKKQTNRRDSFEIEINAMTALKTKLRDSLEIEKLAVAASKLQKKYSTGEPHMSILSGL